MSIQLIKAQSPLEFCHKFNSFFFTSTTGTQLKRSRGCTASAQQQAEIFSTVHFTLGHFACWLQFDTKPSFCIQRSKTDVWLGTKDSQVLLSDPEVTSKKVSVKRLDLDFVRQTPSFLFYSEHKVDMFILLPWCPRMLGLSCTLYGTSSCQAYSTVLWPSMW